MYEFHYDYIKNKQCNNSRLLFTETDSLMYEDVFFSIIILITQTDKIKKYYNHEVLFYISSTSEKGKQKTKKLKQSEIEVKMIIKMKKHNLCSNWQIVFMSDTN